MAIQQQSGDNLLLQDGSSLLLQEVSAPPIGSPSTFGHIGSGWANNCGTELFTLGWVQCEVVVVTAKVAPDSSGYDEAAIRSLRKQSKYNKQFDLHHKKILIQEDEELIVMTILLIREGII